MKNSILRLFSLILGLMLVFSCNACLIEDTDGTDTTDTADTDGTDTTVDTGEETDYTSDAETDAPETPEEVIKIYNISDRFSEADVKSSVLEYRIVYAGDAEQKILDAVALLADSIEDSTGTRPEIVTDAETATGKEIIVGDASRESVTLAKEVLGESSYALYTDDGGNIILIGADSDRSYYAAEDFAAIYFDYQNFTNIRLLKDGTDYEATGNQIFTFNSTDPTFYTTQGGYYDGEEYHICIIKKLSDNHELTRILVLDSEGNFVRESEPLNLDHSNNITYNPNLGMFVVTHCQAPEGHYNYLSMVDPETLTVVRTAALDYPFFALAYSPELDKYASGQWGGGTLNVWDADFNPIHNVDVEEPETLSQGVFCDAEGIYFVRSSRNGHSSEIRIYDWECNLVRIVPIALTGGVEPENVNIIDGRLFITGTDWNLPQGVAYTVTFAEK